MSDFVAKLSASIQTTGFLLEYRVMELLKEFGWTVISNRYFEDDLTNTPREIDLLAYKSQSFDDIRYYYTLIVSCKKSSDECWVLYTRKYEAEDPNGKNNPFLAWTNDSISGLKIAEDRFDDAYKKVVDASESLSSISTLTTNAFAFQQFSLKDAKKANDKDIYSSIISTIKAAEYEIRYLPKRKKEKAVYCFELVSIFEGKLFEVLCEEGNHKLSEASFIKYQNRFIISGKDRFYRVNFFTFDQFGLELLRYNKCKDETFSMLAAMRSNFYTDIFINHTYLNLFSNDMKPQIDRRINYCLQDYELQIGTFSGLYYDTATKTISVETDIYEDGTLDILNKDEYMRHSVAFLLKNHLRYEGKFVFTNDIRF